MGSFLIFAFVGILGFDFLSASASAKTINWCTNLASIIFFAATGHLLYGVGAAMAVSNVIGATLGSAARHPQRQSLRPHFFSHHRLRAHREARADPALAVRILTSPQFSAGTRLNVRFYFRLQMKKSFRVLFSALMIALATTAFAASPALNVTVSDASGKLAYKGKTMANGTFATNPLPPGQYTVQFNSSAALKGSYGLVLSAGKQKTVSDALEGSKFAKGGVAMRIKVGQGLNITGQITSGKTVATAATGNPKVKIVNGKRYVWQGPETGSHLGGRWVEEGSVMSSGVIKTDGAMLSGLQEKGSTGSYSGR